MNAADIDCWRSNPAVKAADIEYWGFTPAAKPRSESSRHGMLEFEPAVKAIGMDSWT